MKLTSFCDELPPEGRLLIIKWSDCENIGIRFGEIVHLFISDCGIHHLVNLAVPYNDKTFKWSLTPQEEIYDETLARFAISNRVIRHYGFTHQLVKTLEELGECSTEIARAATSKIKGRNLTEEQLDKLASEIADCQFLFDQLGLMHGLQDKIDRFRFEKEARQLQRMTDERGDHYDN